MATRADDPLLCEGLLDARRAEFLWSSALKISEKYPVYANRMARHLSALARNSDSLRETAINVAVNEATCAGCGALLVCGRTAAMASRKTSRSRRKRGGPMNEFILKCQACGAQNALDGITRKQKRVRRKTKEPSEHAKRGTLPSQSESKSNPPKAKKRRRVLGGDRPAAAPTPGPIGLTSLQAFLQGVGHRR